MEIIKKILKDTRLWCVVASVAVMAILAIAFFYPDAVQGNVLQQPDIRQGMAIGQEAKAYQEATGESTRWTNSLFSGMPTFQISPSYDTEPWFKWIGTVMGLGLPSPANLLFMMMVGFFILLMVMEMRWYIALIGAIAYGFSTYFIIIIGAGHIWKFVTLAYIPPTVAGMVLCYRGRYLVGGALTALFAMMQIASNHVQMTYYFLFVMLGMAVAYLITAIKQKRFKQWAIATGVLCAAGLLGVGANLPSLYNTYEYSKETMRGGHSELSHDASSANATSGLNRDYITQYSYGRSETFTLLIPNVKGGASAKPVGGSMTMMTLADLDEVKDAVKAGQIGQLEASYLSYFTQYFGEPESTNGPIYIGALIFALFLVGCIIVKGPMKWALVALTILSVLLAMGRNCMWLTDLMIDYMPMYSKFRTVESILVIAEFTMPLLAVMALSKLLTDYPPAEAWAKYKKAIMSGFGVALLFCLLGIVAPSIYGEAITDHDRQMNSMITQMLMQQGYDSAQVQMFSLNNPAISAAMESARYSMVESDSLRSFMIIAFGLGLLLLYYYRKINLAVAAGGIALVVVADLCVVNKRYLDSDSFVAKQLTQGDMFPLTQADRTILADTAMNYRVMNLPQFNSPDPSYRHKAIGGYHAAKLARYQDIIDRHLSHFLNNSAIDADWNVLNMLNAKYVVAMDGSVVLNPEAYGNAWFVDDLRLVDDANAEMDALSSINPRHQAVAHRSFAEALGSAKPTAESDTIFQTSYAPNRLTYHADSSNGGLAVFSEVYFPWGWQATIDGKPAEIGRVDYILRAVQIPAGSHTVEMIFDPQSLHTTTNISRIAIILIYLALGASIALGVVRCLRKDWR